MRGTNHQLVVTTTIDEATENEVPLFAFPAQLCKASNDADVKFDRAAPSGAEYEVVYRDTATGELFPYSEIRVGVRTGDSFAEIPSETVKAIDASIKTADISVERVVPLADVPVDRVIDRLFLQVPAKGGSARYFHGLYEALRPRKKKGKLPARPARALQVTYVGRTRQKLGAVYADEASGALVLLTLRFAAEVREPDEQVLAHQHAEVAPEEVEKISAVLDGLEGEADFDAPTDAVLPKRQELIDKALAGDVIAVPEAADAVPAEDLSAAIEKSLAAAAV